jgi:hypothetical protein
MQCGAIFAAVEGAMENLLTLNLETVDATYSERNQLIQERNILLQECEALECDLVVVRRRISRINRILGHKTNASLKEPA